MPADACPNYQWCEGTRRHPTLLWCTPCFARLAFGSPVRFINLVTAEDAEAFIVTGYM